MGFVSVVENHFIVLPGREEHVVDLSLIPANDLQLELSYPDEDIVMSALVSSVRVSVDSEHHGDVDRREGRRTWLASFEKCCRATTLPMEYPLRFDLHQGLASFGGMENFDADKYQRAIGTGVPPPQSPSMQVQAHSRRQRRRSDFRQSEREERGWWSFRFKEVYLEMQRNER